MTFDDFRSRIGELLSAFEAAWSQNQREHPESFPDALPFEDWWCDFQEEVECLSIGERGGPPAI